MIVSAYTAGDISLGKAAELMGVSHEEVKDILVESGAASLRTCSGVRGACLTISLTRQMIAHRYRSPVDRLDELV